MYRKYSGIFSLWQDGFTFGSHCNRNYTIVFCNLFLTWTGNKVNKLLKYHKYFSTHLFKFHDTCLPWTFFRPFKKNDNFQSTVSGILVIVKIRENYISSNIYICKVGRWWEKTYSMEENWTPIFCTQMSRWTLRFFIKMGLLKGVGNLCPIFFSH